MANYKLTLAADADIDRLFAFGFETFGLEQAEKYVSGLYEHLDNLANYPKSWPTVEHIRKGYRRSVYKTHSIYYRFNILTSLFCALLCILWLKYLCLQWPTKRSKLQHLLTCSGLAIGSWF